MDGEMVLIVVVLVLLLIGGLLIEFALLGPSSDERGSAAPPHFDEVGQQSRYSQPGAHPAAQRYQPAGHAPGAYQANPYRDRGGVPTEHPAAPLAYPQYPAVVYPPRYPAQQYQAQPQPPRQPYSQQQPQQPQAMPQPQARPPDGYSRPERAPNRERAALAANGRDALAEHERYGDFDMIYDPYDGGASYESPW